MNASPPVFQAQSSSDAAQPSAAGSAALASPRAGTQDFAAALSDAGGKPVRKNVTSKHQDASLSGSSLPPPGNQPPRGPSSPPPTKGSAAVVADAPAVAKGSPGGVQGSAPNGAAAASTTPPTTSGATTILTAEKIDTAAPPVPTPALASTPSPAAAAPSALAAAAALAVPPASAAGVDATIPPSANVPTVPASGPSLRTPAAPGTPTTVTVPAVAAGSAATSSGATANQGTLASANSTPSSGDATLSGSTALNDSTSSSGPAAAGTDAAVQAAMAAAVAQGTSVPAPDSAFANELVTSDGDLQSGAAALSGPAAGAAAAGAAAAALAQASVAAMSAAVTAAAAASVAQAVSPAISASAADKRSHGNSPDSLAGATNDGSVGAAQLLTSNTSNDSAPTPTFKVAAGVDTAQFGQGVADRVSLMMDGNVTSAKLQVNPPALGPIEVRIALQGGHAQVSFSSHSALTRDALESSSEKLREMLSSQGFSSVSVDISQRSFQERSPPSHAYESAPSISADAPVLAQAPLSMTRSANGLLDAYA